MDLNFNIIHLIVLLGAAHGLLLATLMLGVKRFRKLPNYFLALFLMAFSFENIASVLYDSNYVHLHPELIYLPFSWNLVFGPAFYFYARTLLDEKFKLKPWHAIFFAPFVLQLGVYGYMFALRETKKVALLAEDALRNWIHFENFMIFALAGTALFLTLRLIYPMRQQFEDLSLQKQRSLKWIEGIVGFLMLIFGIWLLESAIHYSIGGLDNFRVSYLLWTMMVGAIYWIGYNGYLYPQIFQNIEQKEVVPKTEKYQYSTIKTEQAESILQKVQQLMSEKKLYQNARLTLQELANQTDTTPNALSQVINDKLDKNFADFVNGYRIEDVKKKLLDKAYSHYTILAIALECGFNSKSSFNTIFKKHTLQTPSQFRKSHQKTPKIGSK